MEQTIRKEFSDTVPLRLGQVQEIANFMQRVSTASPGIVSQTKLSTPSERTMGSKDKDDAQFSRAHLKVLEAIVKRSIESAQPEFWSLIVSDTDQRRRSEKARNAIAFLAALRAENNPDRTKNFERFAKRIDEDRRDYRTLFDIP
jgi:hypothetical protein